MTPNLSMLAAIALKNRAVLIIPAVAFTLNASAPELRVETETGFEKNSIEFWKIIYSGSCPGIGFTPNQIRGQFRSSSTPPATGRRVKITNISEFMDNDPYPYTDRKYDRGEYSEGFKIAPDRKHRTRTFSIGSGENELKYEISENKTIVEEGSFTVKVIIHNIPGSIRREQVCTSSEQCSGSGKRRRCRPVISCRCEN